MRGTRKLCLLFAGVMLALGSLPAVANAAESEDGYGNNLSTPVVFAEGIGITGLPVDQATGLRGTPGAASLTEPTVIDGVTYYKQNTVNEWQAGWAQSSAPATQRVQVDWGDNLISHTWNAASKVRIETTLYNEDALAPPLTAYEMASLGGTQMNEEWGTTGVTSAASDPYSATVFSVLGHLRIEKLDAEGGNPIGTGPVYDSAVWQGVSGAAESAGFGSEVNASGKVIYGDLWDLTKLDLTAIGLPNEPKEGWYRVTFSLDPEATYTVPAADEGGTPTEVSVTRNVALNSLNPLDLVGETDEDSEGGGSGSGSAYYPPYLVDDASSYVDINILPASNGGGGEGGGGDDLYGNNLSTPVTFAEGIGVTGLPVEQATGLRGTPGEASLTEPTVIDGVTYYKQNTVNEWQAGWAQSSAPDTQRTQVDWGDNLTSHTWNGESKVRIETTLYNEDPLAGPLTAYEMASLGGTQMDEEWGTTGATSTVSDPYTATVFSVLGHLKIEKLDAEGGNPIGTGPIYDSAIYQRYGITGRTDAYSAEVNASGKVIYGHLWDLTKLDLTAIGLPEKPKFGWYRVTFTIDPAADYTVAAEDEGGTPTEVSATRNASIVSLNPLDLVGESGEDEGGGGGSGGGSDSAHYTPQLVGDTTTYIDIYIASSHEGGGGGGGGGGGDSGKPSSHGTGAALNPDTGTITVTYDASDDKSGVVAVELWAKGPGQSDFQLVATDTSGAASGSFTYEPTAGEGEYAFYTIAIDRDGNREDPPGGPDQVVQYRGEGATDLAAPSSTASGPAETTSHTIDITYTATDTTQQGPGHAPSGVATVDLYAMAPGHDGFAKAGTVSSGAGTGSFTYEADAGDGSYAFYTIATDVAGNVEEAPAAPDLVTEVVPPPDTEAPWSAASAPAVSTSNTFTITYLAGDDVSGVSTVDLYAKTATQGEYVKVATASGDAGAFTYEARAGDGVYRFYTVATDAVGHVEEAPDSPDAMTEVETTIPVSAATAPAITKDGAFVVRYSASHRWPGVPETLDSVELWVRGPGEADYRLYATDSDLSTPVFAFSASKDGTYAFYTRARDLAGNYEQAPSVADTTTKVDRRAPVVSKLRASPNPFNPTVTSRTAITFQTDSYAKVGVTIRHNGKVVRHLAVRWQNKGKVTRYWNGENDAGALVRPGTYTVRVTATDKAGNRIQREMKLTVRW